MNHDNDLPRDAHLRAALRHAPDRDVAPPAALSARLLEAARAPTRVAPSAGPGARLWDRLAALGRALTQPTAGAAFASLMLATVIGLMWRDGPPPEALPDEPLGVRAPAVDAAPGAAPAPARTDEAETRGAPPAVSPAPRMARESAPRPADAAAPPPPAAARPAPSRSVREPPDAVTAEPPALPPPTPAPAAPPAAAAPAAEADASAGRRTDDPAGRAAPAELGAQKSAARPLALERSAAARADNLAEADPLAAALVAWAQGGAADRERRAPSADGQGAMTRAWLQEAQSQARGRWQRSEQPLSSSAFTLLAPDGRPLGRIEFDEDALRWQPADAAAPVWRAPLPPAALARLRADWAALPAAPSPR